MVEEKKDYFSSKKKVEIDKKEGETDREKRRR